MIPVCSQMTAEYQCNKEALHRRASCIQLVDICKQIGAYIDFRSYF